MSTNMVLPDQLHIEQIRKKLWNNSTIGQVSVMVGAGFSLNANKISEHSSNFLLWNELIKKMKDDLYPYQDNSINSATSEALKLANEYEMVFGRQALDELILKSLPDTNYTPGDLHKLLLSLPWSDVFTTNYDTLLERTTKYVYDRKYSVVVTPSDIASASRPRIVKLHGSFPSYRPFIITEEDYRTYPSKFSPFINMVQQSIMENILCLIGFSGDDPNFLNWIGWVKDTIGKNSNQIYFIGFVNQSQRRILEARGIITIDLSPLFPDDKYSINEKHRKSLEWFLINLKTGKKLDITEWPKLENSSFKQYTDRNDLPHIPITEYEYSYIDGTLRSCGFNQKLGKNNLISLINEWSKIRKSYPGWVIAPKSKREYIRTNTNSYNILSELMELNLHEQLSLVYELNWRYEIALTPLAESIANNMTEIIENIDPFKNRVKLNNNVVTLEQYENKLKEDVSYKNYKLDYSKIKKEWIELAFSLLRFSREELNRNLFETIKSKIEKSICNSNEYKSRLCYEVAMWELTIRDENNIRLMLDEWEEIDNIPIYNIKRAGILAEIGELKKAEEVSEKALNDIRKNIIPGEVDVSILSQEGWAMLLVKSIKNNNSYYRSDIQYHKEYTDRWRVLNEYNCDPWSEIEWMRDVIAMSDPSQNKSSITSEFDRGMITRHFSLGESIDEQIYISYSFIKMLENIGIPHRFGNTTMFKKSAINAAKWISKYSPAWALSTLIRCDEQKELNFIISRDKLQSINDNKINDYFKIFSNALDIAIVNEPSNGYSHHFYPIQIKNLSEIVSRLIIRLNDEQIYIVYNIVLKMYKSFRIQRDYTINKYIGILLKRLFKNMTNTQKLNKIKELLQIDIYMEKQYKIHREDYQVFLFDYINFDYNIINNEDSTMHEFKNIIEEIFELLKDKDIAVKDRAFVRLKKLYKLGLLNEKEKEVFGHILWRDVDEFNKLPVSTKFLKNIDINLPSPNDIDIKNLYLNYIKNTDIPDIYLIGIDEEGNEHISYNHDLKFRNYINTLIGLVYTLYKTESDKYISLKEENIKELLEKLYKFWNNQKEMLITQNPFNIFDENKEHVRDIIRFLTLVIEPNLLNDDKESIDKLKIILEEIERSGYSILYALPPTLSLGLINETELKNKIVENIISDKDENSIASISAIYYWMLINSNSKNTVINIELFDILINSMYYNKGNILKNIVQILSSIIKENLIELSDENIEKLVPYLKCKLNDLKGANKNTIECIDQVYYISNLSKELYKVLEKQNKNIPQIVIDWKIYTQQSKLRDMQNIWKN